MQRILVGFTYSMFMLAQTAQRSGVRIVLPRPVAFVGYQLGLEVVDLPSFRSAPDAAAELNQLIEKHNIDAFWPLNASAYDLSGVTAAPVHAVCRHETYQMVNDKVTFANWLKDSMFRPEGIQTVGAEKTIIEVLTRLEKGQTVCIKPPRGVNGGLYWQISYDANLLADPAERKISPRAFEIALRERERDHGLEPWLVMEVLQGPELSIDALCIEGDLRKWMIREKDSPSTQIVRSDHEIIAHVRHIVKALGLHGLVSVQYMFDKDGRIKILEINLRPSGGCIGYGEVALGQAGTSDLVTDWLQYMAGMITSKDIKPWKGEVRIKIQPTASLV